MKTDGGDGVGEPGGRKRKWPLILLAAVVVLGGLAFAGYRFYLNEAHDEAVKLVPSNALVYSNLFLSPSTHQKQALRDLLAKFPGAGTPDEARSTLERYLDRALASTGVEFSDDIEPWLGREVAIAMIPPLASNDPASRPNVIGYIATTDGDKAMSVVDRINESQGVQSQPSSYEGFDYEIFDEDQAAAGIVGDFLLIATNEASFRHAVDAYEGDSLASTARYRDAVAALPGDRIALAYASLPGFVSALMANGDLPANAEATFPQLGRTTPIAAAAYLRPDGIVIEASFESRQPDSGAGDVLDMAPRDAWAAVGLHDLGSGVRSSLDAFARSSASGRLGSAALVARLEDLTGLDLEDDILSWMGDAAGFVEGRALPRGGVVVESTDSRRSASAVHRFGQAMAGRGYPVGVGHHDSTHARVAFADPGLPSLIQLVAVPGSVWLTFGAETANEIGSATLEDSPTFERARSAMGDYSLVGYLNVDGAVTSAENTFERSGEELPRVYTSKVAPNLEPVSFVALGTRTRDGVTSVKLMIGVE